MKILIALASPIIRPNGIMTFITQSANILHSLGHQVDLITDAEPSIDLSKWFDGIFFDPRPTNYPIEIIDNKPNINYLPHIHNRIHETYSKMSKYDVVVSNDLQSTAAFINDIRNTKVVHYIHTGALLDPNVRFLSDSYVQLEREIMTYCDVVSQHSIINRNAAGKDGHIIHLPLEDYKLFLNSSDETQSGLVFVGEGTYGKGADVFEQACIDLDLEAKIVASSLLDVTFDSIRNKTIRSFSVDDIEEKAKFIRSGKAAYHPARCEVFPYAIIESLLSMPVVIPSEYIWAEPFSDVGALVVPKDEVYDTLQMVMAPEYVYSNEKILRYVLDAKSTWVHFLNNV